jgi:hypothetical protein
MSVSAAHFDEFARDVVTPGGLWTVRDAGGHPAPTNAPDVRGQPFWSILSRVTKVVAGVLAYAGSMPEEIDLAAFRRTICLDLQRHGVRRWRDALWYRSQLQALR